MCYQLTAVFATCGGCFDGLCPFLSPTGLGVVDRTDEVKFESMWINGHLKKSVTFVSTFFIFNRNTYSNPDS